MHIIQDMLAINTSLFLQGVHKVCVRRGFHYLFYLFRKIMLKIYLSLVELNKIVLFYKVCVFYHVPRLNIFCVPRLYIHPVVSIAILAKN